MTESNTPENEGNDPRRHPEYDRVFNDYLDQLNSKGFVDPDRVVEKHPDVGAAILEDLETFVQIHSEDDEAPLGTLGDYTLRRHVVNANLIGLTRHHR